MADYVIGGAIALAFLYGMKKVYLNASGKESCCTQGTCGCGCSGCTKGK